MQRLDAERREARLREVIEVLRDDQLGADAPRRRDHVLVVLVGQPREADELCVAGCLDDAVVEGALDGPAELGRSFGRDSFELAREDSLELVQNALSEGGANEPGLGHPEQ